MRPWFQFHLQRLAVFYYIGISQESGNQEVVFEQSLNLIGTGAGPWNQGEPQILELLSCNFVGVVKIVLEKM